MLQQAQRAQVPDVVVGDVEFLGGAEGEGCSAKAAPTSCPLSALPLSSPTQGRADPPSGQERS